MPRKKNTGKNVGISLLVVAMLVGGIWFAMDSGWFEGSEQTGLGGTDKEVLSTCPDDGTTTVTFNLKNGLNNTGNELFDATMYFDDGTTLADTTAGTSSQTCGVSRTAKMISVNADAGDSARVVSVSGDCANLQLVDGNLMYTPSNGQCTINMIGKQHGVLEFRAFDEVNNAFMYDSGDASATDYETDGVTFTSTTDNATALAVGTGGEVKQKISARSTLDDTDFSDFGVYVLVDADPSKWDKPVLKVDGQTLSEANLNSDEQIAWSSYEYAYFIDKAITRNGEVDVSLNIFALSGVNPGSSDDIQIDFASKGQFVSLDGVNEVARSGVQDDSSRSVVYTVQDTTIDIS